MFTRQVKAKNVTLKVLVGLMLQFEVMRHSPIADNSVRLTLDSKCKCGTLGYRFSPVCPHVGQLFDWSVG